MASGICYHAYLVKDGIIDYISPVNTRQGAVNLVKCWKRNGAIFAESFASSIIPQKWKAQIEAYWNEYEKTHQRSKIEVDPDELPF